MVAVIFGLPSSKWRSRTNPAGGLLPDILSEHFVK
jgi:hypothetical protein